MAGQSLMSAASPITMLVHNSPGMPASTTAEMTASLLHFFSARGDWPVYHSVIRSAVHLRKDRLYKPPFLPLYCQFSK